MKTIVFSIAVAAIIISCGNNNDSSKQANKTADTTTSTTQTSNATDNKPASSDEIITAYLQLKNALTNDNAKEAGSAGKQLHEAMLKLDQASFTDDQKKVYDDVKDDIKEHAEHISTKDDDIAHQREHFDMLSQGMYDLIKAVKPTQTLYQTHCPMYNDKKGAIWLSETKEIKNPYYGKKMLTCGEVKEEIKP